MREWMYRSAFSWLTSALVGGEWVVSFTPRPLYPRGKTPPPSVPLGQEAGWAPEPVWTTWRRQNYWPYRDSNSDPSVMKPVDSRCTDYATPNFSLCLIKHHAIKTYGEWGYSSTILDLGTRWRWVVGLTPGRTALGTHSIRGWVGPRAGLDAVG
jgi:hypothetical protein